MTMLLAPPPALPKVGALLRHAAPRVLEGMILPVAVFYAGLLVTGDLLGAIAIAVVWVYAGVAWRLLRRRAVPGAMLLAAGAITVRAVLVLLFHDPMWFFLQPTLGVFCASAGFLLTARISRPLVQRVVADLVPLPDHVVESPRMRRFFRRQSLLWGCAQLGNASLSLWLLLMLNPQIEMFLLVRTGVVAVLLGLTALASVLDLRWTLRALEPGVTRT